MSYVDRSVLIQASPKVKSWGPNLVFKIHELHSKSSIMILEAENEREIRINTKLRVDNGHVRNSLITIIISHTVEFFGAYINSRYFQRRFPTYLRINLHSARTLILIS
jgi:hypothetical protein